MRLKIGDVFCIPLKNDECAIGQYIFLDKTQGTLISISRKLLNREEIEIDRVDFYNKMFPPVFTNLHAIIRSEKWQVIGRKAVANFTYPKFISCYFNEITGEAYRWFLWDGYKYLNIGSKLEEQYKQLEFLIIWNDQSIAHRIISGSYPYPFGDLIKYNRFNPSETGHYL